MREFSWFRYWMIALPVVIGCFYWMGAEEHSDMERRETVPIGTVKSIQEQNVLLGAKTLLTLTDGTVIKLSGTFNPWKPGDEVSHPVRNLKIVADHPEQFWCIRNTCLREQL